MTRLLNRSITAAVAILACLHAPAGAQTQTAISGQVLGPEGLPIPEVRIDALGRSGILATTATNDEGRFRFATEEVEGIRALRASLIGFEEVEVPYLPETRRYVIQLGNAVVALQGILVSLGGLQCTVEDGREAHTLWDEMRNRYRSARALDTLGIASYVSSAVSVGSGDPVAPLELPEEAFGRHGSASLLRFSWRRRAERDGYAYPIRRNDLDRAYPSWAYAPLESDFATHFVDEAFGELHEFEVAQTSSDGWTITFCPKEEERPGIVGELKLAPDTSLISAEWVFRTPDPVEDAGGKAVFTDVRIENGEPYLLPLESFFWRRLPVGQFYKKHERFEEWRVIRGDSVPFLPIRGSISQQANR